MPKQGASGKSGGGRHKPVGGSGGLTPAHGKQEKIHHGGFASKDPTGGGDGSSMRD